MSVKKKLSILLRLLRVQLSDSKNINLFFELLRFGLFPERAFKGATFIESDEVSWDEVYRLAEEQSVVGIIATGLDIYKVQNHGVNIPQEWALQFIGSSLQLEQRNKAMNDFIGVLMRQLRAAGVYALLVKGQGIAQCYENPLWRASGDVDLLLNTDNYKRAKEFLCRFATSIEEENIHKHLGMTVDGWTVELHGTLRSGSLKKMDAVVDKTQEATFYEGQVRAWRNGETDIFLPEENNDVIFVFTHIVKHFFHEGIGLRQICDWCRLLWTFKDSLNRKLLETRINDAGLKTEWLVFAAFAVDYLGIPEEAMPLYETSKKWSNKANKLLFFILMTGNFGHNRDLSYYQKQPRFQQKFLSFKRHSSDAVKRFRIFPKDTITVWCRMFVSGIKVLG